MKILLTGHKWFLWNEFIKAYGAGYEIVGYDIQDGDDLTDIEKLKKVSIGCSMIVHLAAIPKPIEGISLNEYFQVNVVGTKNILETALENNIKRVIYASSTTIYGIERGIPFQTPINEQQPFISQYLQADDLHCRECDLSYHTSKVMAEQLLAWYGFSKKIQTVALRFWPIGKIFLGTSVSINNATQAIDLAIKYRGKLYYEAFSVVDDLPHIDISKIKNMLGYVPETFEYSAKDVH